MPTTPVLANPTTYAGLILSAGKIRGVDTGTPDFFIKVLTARHRHRSPMQEISGDGDSGPNIAVSYWLYVDWMIRGHMVAGKEMGLANMQDTARNPTADGSTLSALVKFVYGGTNSVAGRFVIGGIDVEYMRKSRVVGVSFFMRNTVDADGAPQYVEDLTPGNDPPAHANAV